MPTFTVLLLAGMSTSLLADGTGGMLMRVAIEGDIFPWVGDEADAVVRGETISILSCIVVNIS
jgi:hypothetical protein